MADPKGACPTDPPSIAINHDPQVSIFNAGSDSANARYTRPLSTILRRVRGEFDQDPRGAAEAREIAALRAETNPHVQKAIKDHNLSAFTPAGTFGKREAGAILERSGYTVVDVDGLEPEQVALFRAQAATSELPGAVAAFRSPRGRGVKILVRLDPVPDGQDDHDRATAAVALAYSSAYLGVPVDSGFDESRLCYLSRDEHVQWRALPVDGFRWDTTAPRAEQPRPAGDGGGAVTVEAIVEAHGELTETPTQWEGPCKLCGGTKRFHVNKRPGRTAAVLLDCRECDATFGDHLRALGFAVRDRTAVDSEHALAVLFADEHRDRWAWRHDAGWFRWTPGAGWRRDPGASGLLEAVAEFGRAKMQ